MKPAKEAGSSEQSRKSLLSVILLSLFFLALFCALWWAALWLALPVEWLQGELPTLVLLHIAPPVLALVAWRAGRWAWGWRKTRAKRLANEREAAGKQATQDAAYASHLKEVVEKRAHLVCRGVWADVARKPEGLGDGSPQCVWQKYSTEASMEAGSEAALLSSLQQVFFDAIAGCEALPWLPVYTLSKRGAEESATQQKLILQAMRQAVVVADVDNPPQQPECITLPGSGNVADRLIALFDNNPALPAAILVGIDSPLGEVQETENFGFDPRPKPENVVVTVLLSRPGLTAPDATQIARIEAIRNQANNPMTPHWEREQARGENLNQLLHWDDKMPVPMQLAFLKNLPPLATLHKTSTIQNPATKNSALTQQFQEAIQKALVCAGLREQPFKSEEPQDEQAKPAEKPKPVEPKPLELGWLVHNVGADGIGALLSGLGDFGCELDLFAESSNLEKESVDTGATRSVLMLAEALTRAAQLQQPVLVAEFEETRRIDIGLTCPVTQKASTNTKSPGQPLETAA